MSELTGITIRMDAGPFLRDLHRVAWMVELHLGRHLPWWRSIQLRVWLQEVT